MTSIHRIFEFSLYNDVVRNLVQSGESHNQLGDGWAEQRYIQIKAEDEEKAHQELLRRYPEHIGFVVTSVVELFD